MEISLYDFDKTIYDGDSTVDFYLFCLKKKKTIVFLLPKQLLAAILYKLKVINKKEFKEKFFCFLNKFSNIDFMVDDFWNINDKKIKKWYLEKNHKNDIIISASPEFLLLPMAKKLNVMDLIATKVDKENGKFLSQNCYGSEKVKRLREKYQELNVTTCYTDSLSDKPILGLAKKGYIVKGDKIYEYKD